jgi:hypothetical protein
MGVKGLKVPPNACIFARACITGRWTCRLYVTDAGLTTASDAPDGRRHEARRSRHGHYGAIEHNDPDAPGPSILSPCLRPWSGVVLLIPDAHLRQLVGSMDIVRDRISGLVKKDVTVLGKMSAAIGLAQIARDVHGGKKEILGIGVDL